MLSPSCGVDHNGVVSLPDHAHLLGNYRTASGMTYEDGDLNGDGAVALPDLAGLLVAFLLDDRPSRLQVGQPAILISSRFCRIRSTVARDGCRAAIC